MGYPGDQGKPGGWSNEPPAPFGPGVETEGQDDSPFAPRPGEFAARPGERPGDQFGASPNDPFGPPAGPGAPWEAASGGSFGPGSFDAEAPPAFGPGGPGPGGPGGVPEELYGSTGEGYFSGGAGAGGGGFDGGGYDELGNGRSQGGPAGPAYPDKRNNLPLIIGGAVVAGIVLIGGGFGVSSMFKDDKKPAAAKSPAQNQPSPSQAAPKSGLPAPGPLNAKLKSRGTDPKPLTLNEVFGKRTFTGAGEKYVRTAWRVDRSCAKGVNGAKLAAALKKGGCTQVLRATFARTDGKLIGTVGVLNLKTLVAAKNAAKAGAGRDAYLQPLAGTGTTKKIGKGDALGTASVRGHYLVMTWVQRPDGKTIQKKFHTTVTAFGTQVILGSNLGKALRFRGIEGKPFTG